MITVKTVSLLHGKEEFLKISRAPQFGDCVYLDTTKKGYVSRAVISFEGMVHMEKGQP